MEKTEQEKTELSSELKVLKKGAVDLTVGSPLKCILRFALPLIFGNVFQLFYSWTDAIMLGNIKGDSIQFSALSGSIPVINLMLTFVNGFLVGATVVIGQLFGKRRFDELKNAYSTLLISMVALSLCVGFVGIFLARPLLQLIQIDPIYLDFATVYLRFYFAGMIFVALYNAFAQVLRSIGNSVVPLVALIICVLLNVLLDFLFVVVADMGIEGVAIGTMIAQFVSAVLMFAYVQIKVPLLKLKFSKITFDKSLLKAMVKLGIPSTIQSMCACVGFMIINGIVNGNGAEFTTAFGLGNRVDEMLTQVNQSLGATLSSFAAQNKGKGDIKRIKQGYRAGILLMACTILTLASLIYIFRNELLNLFVNLDVENDKLDLVRVVEIANVFLSIYLPSFIMLCYMFSTSCLIRGAGSAKLAMSINLITLCIRVISAFLLNSQSVYGVFYASPIGWFAGSICATLFYFFGGWQKNKSVV